MIQLGQYPAPTHVIAHISDTHLLAGARPLYGKVNVIEHLEQALQQLERSIAKPQALVFTGDLADLGEPDAYERLKAVVEPAAERIAALGGFQQVGDEGIGVVVLRAGLHRLGYGLQPGGTYDAETETTVRAFQRHWRPSRVDGVADGQTRATLMGVLQLATAESVTGVLN